MTTPFSCCSRFNSSYHTIEIPPDFCKSNTILSNKGLTKEDKDTVKATREEFAKNWKPGQEFDTNIYKQKFKNGKPYLVVK